MAKNTRDIKVLASKICSEVQAYIPTQYERDNARPALIRKIEDVLGNNNQYGDAVPESRRVTILLSDIRGFI